MSIVAVHFDHDGSAPWFNGVSPQASSTVLPGKGRSCNHEIREKLPLFLANELSPRERTKVRDHLSMCDDCRRLLAGLENQSTN